MSKWLSGSAKTGDKILKNKTLFKYTYKGIEQGLDNEKRYKFDWNLGDQNGYINIKYNDGKISNGSLISTYESSKHPFDRPLGLYNDSTLLGLFQMVMTSVNIKIDGIYNEPF